MYPTFMGKSVISALQSESECPTKERACALRQVHGPFEVQIPSLKAQKEAVDSNPDAQWLHTRYLHVPAQVDKYVGQVSRYMYARCGRVSAVTYLSQPDMSAHDDRALYFVRFDATPGHLGTWALGDRGSRPRRHVGSAVLSSCRRQVAQEVERGLSDVHHT